jgi:hypothetical protein
MRVLLYYILLYSYLIRTSFKRAFRRLFFVVLLFAGMLYSAQCQSYLFTGKQDTSSVNFATRNLTLTGNRIHNADNKTVDFINLPFPNSFQLNGVSLPDYPPIEDDVFLLYQTDGTFKYAGIDSIGQVVASDDQNLTLVEDTLSIEDGNSVVFSDFVRLQDSLTVFVTPDQLQDSLDNFPAGSDDQNLTLVEDTLSIEDGNSVVFSDFVRLQDSLTVFVTPDQLQDSLNNFPAGSDDQNLTLVEDTLSIEDGNSVVFSDFVRLQDSLTVFVTPDQLQDSLDNFPAGSDDQNLTLVEDTLSIEDGNSVVFSNFVRLQDSLTVFVTPDQLQDSLGGFSAIDSLFYQINNDPAIFVDQKNGANDTLNFSFSSIDTTQFVKYQDSLTVFVTPDQLSDTIASLNIGGGIYTGSGLLNGGATGTTTTVTVPQNSTLTFNGTGVTGDRVRFQTDNILFDGNIQAQGGIEQCNGFEVIGGIVDIEAAIYRSDIAFNYELDVGTFSPTASTYTYRLRVGDALNHTFEIPEATTDSAQLLHENIYLEAGTKLNLNTLNGVTFSNGSSAYTAKASAPPHDNMVQATDKDGTTDWQFIGTDRYYTSMYFNGGGTPYTHTSSSGWGRITTTDTIFTQGITGFGSQLYESNDRIEVSGTLGAQSPILEVSYNVCIDVNGANGVEFRLAKSGAEIPGSVIRLETNTVGDIVCGGASSFVQFTGSGFIDLEINNLLGTTEDIYTANVVVKRIK